MHNYFFVLSIYMNLFFDKVYSSAVLKIVLNVQDSIAPPLKRHAVAYFALLNIASTVEVRRRPRLWRTRVRRKGCLIYVQMIGQKILCFNLFL